MTLTEFLLARIAEDVAVAESITLDPDGVAQHFGKAGWVQWFALTVNRPWRGGVASVLAECQAKRRIVEQIDMAIGNAAGEWDTEAGWIADGVEEELVAVGRVLAAVYADHPDYDPAWRL